MNKYFDSASNRMMRFCKFVCVYFSSFSPYSPKSLLVIILMTLSSCHKDKLDSERNYWGNRRLSSISGISEKLTSWFAKHESGISVNKKSNIELLKANLDINAATIENRNDNDILIIIPIKDELLNKKKIDNNCTLNLLVVLDSIKRIKWGSVICFVPTDGKKRNALSPNTFHNILNNQIVEDNGVFKFLSLTGQLLYQLQYKDKKLYSYGVIKNNQDGNPKNINSIKKTNGCTDWYLVTTTYYSDGSSDESWSYIGTTCGGCDNGEYMSLCPDPNPGGNSPPDANDQIIQEHLSFTSEETVYTDLDAEYLGTQIASTKNYDNGTVYKRIAYTHTADMNKNAQTGMITFIYMYPTTASPMSEMYTDISNRNVIRALTLYNHYNSYNISPLGTSVKCTWTCSVLGRYTYSDGSPTQTQPWGHSYTSIH